MQEYHGRGEKGNGEALLFARLFVSLRRPGPPARKGPSRVSTARRSGDGRFRTGPARTRRSPRLLRRKALCRACSARSLKRALSRSPGFAAPPSAGGGPRGGERVSGIGNGCGLTAGSIVVPGGGGGFSACPVLPIPSVRAPTFPGEDGVRSSPEYPMGRVFFEKRQSAGDPEGEGL